MAPSSLTRVGDQGQVLSRDTMRRRYQALGRFRRSAASDPPISRVIEEALGLTQAFLQPDRSAYATRQSEATPFLLAAGTGWREGVIGRDHLEGGTDSLGGHASRLGHPLVVEDLRFFPQFRREDVLIAADTRGVLLAPVRGQQGASGLLGVFSSSRRLFSPEDAEFLRGLGDVIAAALYREDWRLRLAGRSR